MCCFLTNSNNDQDDEENTKAWELYVYGSDDPSVGSRSASSGSLGSFPSGSTSKTSLGSVSVASGNSSMMPFQNGSGTPSPGPSRAPSLRTPSPAHSLRPLGASRSPSMQSLNSVSSLSSGRVSPLNANDVPTMSHSQFMTGFNRRLDETFNLKTRY